MGLLKYLWSNGHRPLVAATVYAIGSTLLLAGALVALLVVTHIREYHPCATSARRRSKRP